MEQAATNLYLQFGVLGVTVVVLFVFSRTVITRMFAREDKNETERSTLILNNTTAMLAVAQRLEDVESAVTSVRCLYAGSRTAQPETRTPPGISRLSDPQPVPQLQGA